MSFKIVSLLKNSQAFDLKELVHSIIDSAVELHGGRDTTQAEGDGRVDSTLCKQQVSEVILFLLDSMQADPECIAPSDLIRLVETVGYGAIEQSHLQGQQRSHSEEMMQSVYKLFAAILLTPNMSGYRELKSRIQQTCLEGLCSYSEEQRLLVNLTLVENDDGKTSSSSSAFSIKDISEILYYTLKTAGPWDTDSEYPHVGVEDSWLEDCFRHLLDILEYSDAATCSHASGILLPKLLSLSKDKLEIRLSSIWQRLLNVYRTAADEKSKQTSNVYIALCGLSEFYIPVVLPSTPDQQSASSSLLADGAFWRVVQAGLVHTDPLARKQACFLMKRSIESASVNHVTIPNESTVLSAAGIATCQEQSSEPGCTASEAASLFWWSPDSQKKLLAVWGDFFLMYETLDEVQVHVVTPVMPRMTSLIQAASTLHSSGRRILHPSWLTVLFSRCFVHETKTVSKWGLLEYLRLDIASCPVLQDIGMEFLLGTVLPVLNDDSLYAGKSRGMVARPLIAEAFTGFMHSCIKILGKQDSESFLRKFLAAVSGQSWSPVSLTFVFDTLTHLPECSAWGPSELQLLREMQFSCVGMLPLTYRSVVQCLMLQAVLKLLDKTTTSLQQLSGLLGLFNICLCRGSPLWKQVCEWFTASQYTQIFGSSGDMVAVVRSEVATLLTFDLGLLSNASMDLADSGESSRVACLVLLAVDTQHTNVESGSSLPSSHPSDGESSLQGILAPLITVLSSIGSHIYLPIIKADTALQLLHGILQYLLHPSPDEESTDKDQVRQEMFSVLSSCLEEMYSFINRRLLSSDIAQSADISRVSLYISVLESTHAFLKKCPRYSLLRNVLANGQTRLTECCKLLMTQSMENKEKNSLLGHFQAFVACRLLLWLLQMNRGSDLLKLPWDTLSPLLTFKDDATTLKGMPNASATTSLRKISNLLLCTKWQCFSILLRDRGSGTALFPVGQSDEAILAACVRDLTLVKGPDAVPIMQCAKVLVNKIGQDTISLCLDLVDAAWSTSLDEWRGKAQKFWFVYSSAVELIFQQCFLVAEEGTEIHDALAKVIGNILTLGEGKPKIVAVFARHLCSQWASQLDDEEGRTPALKAITNHLPLLIQMCSMGSRVSKDIKLQQDTSVYLLQLSNLQAVKDDIVA
ncbi:probable methyltransferase TARBP1 isoform X2 [Patiria miniata]|nr:probable methyltransferase TARBP1 isoform X2 [Patiria miniata]